jgi:hypothetical protein
LEYYKFITVAMGDTKEEDKKVQERLDSEQKSSLIAKAIEVKLNPHREKK